MIATSDAIVHTRRELVFVTTVRALIFVANHQTATTDTMETSGFNPTFPHNPTPWLTVTLLVGTPASIDIIVNGVTNLVNDSVVSFLRIGITE
jgi:hypothetical protein